MSRIAENTPRGVLRSTAAAGERRADSMSEVDVRQSCEKQGVRRLKRWRLPVE